ncbi:MAG TPA: cyclodeaminase/cyclohydrolase family protein [Chloroflexota bacterium]|nr:cyclodeaminase/cyclohydrolase family protein [Chloroflexota bacterium]
MLDPNSSSIDRFLEALAAGSATPGGGAATALAAAAAAALIAMTCRLTLGRDRFRQHERTLAAALQSAERARRHALDLVAGDVAAYAAVSDARALPRATADERRRRAGHIRQSMEGATHVQLRTADVAAGLIELSAGLAGCTNPNAAADLGVGVLLARVALEGAALNVRTNLALIQDEPFRASITAELEQLLRALPRCAELMEQLQPPNRRVQ